MPNHVLGLLTVYAVRHEADTRAAGLWRHGQAGILSTFKTKMKLFKCLYTLDYCKSVLNVAQKPHNGACCDMTHPKNANKDQQVCQQPNLGVDDFEETNKKKTKKHSH